MKIESVSTSTQPRRLAPANRRVSRVGRLLLGVLAVLVAVAAIGAIYQTIATSRDRANYPPPGQLIDVGGYRIHLYSQGENHDNSTVVLIGCGGCTSANWGWVQPEVARFTRVVAFDRAGFGWSEPGPEPRDAAQNARELHLALERAGIPGPYVLVGHSYGGPVARVYASQYASDVAGMVLLDPRSPDRDARFPAEVHAAEQSEQRLIAMLGWMACLGLLRLTPLGQEQARDLPPNQQAAYAATYNTVQYWDSIRAQGAAIGRTDEQARAVRSLGAMPLIVLSADTAWLSPGAPPDATRRVYTELNIEQAALSSNSLHQVVEGTTHTSLVNDQQHAQATIDAIRQVIDAVRDGERLGD
jgi:pimeloyl-ACP methyl ester carboxylesterase